MVQRIDEVKRDNTIPKAIAYNIRILYREEQLPSYIRDGVMRFIANHKSFRIYEYLQYNFDWESIGDKTIQEIQHEQQCQDVVLLIDANSILVVQHLYQDIMVIDTYSYNQTVENIEDVLSTLTAETLPPFAFIISDFLNEFDSIVLRLPEEKEYLKDVFMRNVDAKMSNTGKTGNIYEAVPMPELDMRCIEIGVVLNSNTWYTIDYNVLYLRNLHDSIVAKCMLQTEEQLNENGVDFVHLFLYSTYDVDMYG